MDIRFNTAGVEGLISVSDETGEKILEDKFTSHYLPDFRLSEGGKPHIEVREGQTGRKSHIEFPLAVLDPKLDHRSFIVTAEYLAERDRQERLGVFGLNSSSVQLNGKGILFYGNASNLGKTTYALELVKSGFTFFSDEKTFLDLENNRFYSGSRSVPLRKQILKERFMREGEFAEVAGQQEEVPEVSLIISPHYDHGLKEPIVNHHDELDVFWNLSGAISRRIRGVTRFVDNFTHQLPSIDTEELTERRIELIRRLSKKVPSYYFQGNSKQVVDFVREKLKE